MRNIAFPPPIHKACLGCVVAAPRRQLLQDATTPSLRLLALPIVKASFQQLHRRIWRTADGSQVDAAWRPAPRAFYLKPWKPTVDRLADRRRTLHIFSFQLWHASFRLRRSAPRRHAVFPPNAWLEYPSSHGISQVPCSGPSGHRRTMVSGDVSGPWLKRRVGGRISRRP